MEREFLDMLEYDLFITTEQWIDYTSKMNGLVDKLLALNVAAKED